MDGLWSSQGASEVLQQAELIRHRILTFNVSNAGLKNARDASSFGGNDPNGIPAAGVSLPEGGPHFIMSPRAPEDSKSYGFEFCLLTAPFTDFIVSATAPNSPNGPFDVTIWELIGSTQYNGGFLTPAWASFATQTGILVNQLFHSFDVDATAIRFQIGNFAAPIVLPGGSIMVAFSEL
jgi:hypothetical protein